MHSQQRQVVGTLVSTIVSQVLAILVLLSSSSSSSSPSPPPPHFPFPSALLFHHLSFLLLFLTTTNTSSSSSSSPETAFSDDSSFVFVSHSPPSPSPSRKRKRRLPSEDNNPNRSTHHQQQQRQGEEEEGLLCSHSSSSSSSSSSSIRNRSNGGTPPPLLPLLEDPSSCSLCFRMTSSTFEWLSGLLEPLLECRDPVGSSLNLSAHLRLGIGLFRLAMGSPYPDISRRFSVSESTARFCTKQLCRVLCTNFRFWVAFPNPSELLSVSAAFQALTGLPNCCGIIECTRFEIRGGESIATQIVADSASRILNIATGFRSSRKDEPAVLRSSSLYKDVQGGHLLNAPPAYLEGVAIPQYLIGGKAYPLLPWLMVPSSSSSSSSGDDFNAVHSSARGPALRALASLRNWGILSRPIEEEEINMAVACVGACSILHNVLLMREDFSALSEDAVDDHSLHVWRSSREESSSEEPSTEKASSIRDALAARAREIRANLNQRNDT